MITEKIINRLVAAETYYGLKERFIVIFNKDYDETAQYYFELDKNGNKIYYKDGKIIPLQELEDKYMEIMSITVVS